MALNLYRRHRPGCKGGILKILPRANSERKKSWKRCDCPIFVSGILSGRFHRRSTERWDWADALAVSEEWESDASWNAARQYNHRRHRHLNSKVRRGTIERAVSGL